jgi:hypothetical protein
MAVPPDKEAARRAQIEQVQKELRRQLDYGYRKSTPGYPEYASQAREDLFPSGAHLASTSGIPILSDAADAALTLDALKRKEYEEAAINAAFTMIPFLGAGVLRATKTPPEVPPGYPRHQQFEEARRNAALPVDQGGLGLPPDNTAADRARAMGYTQPVYHGTFADIEEFDSDMSGIGTHVGTIEQANNRLKDVQKQRGGGYGNRAGIKEFDEGANVLPLLMNPGKIKSMRDVGLWNDSAILAEQLPNNSKNLDLYDEANDIKAQFEDYQDWVESPENREFLDELKPEVFGDADTLRYLNEVENTYGSRPSLLPEAKAQVDQYTAARKAIEQKASARVPPVPDDPDQIEAWLDASKRWEDYATPEELKLHESFIDAEKKLKADRRSYNDSASYVVGDSSRLRLRNAAFDPARRESSDLLASYLMPLGLGGLLGAAAWFPTSQDQEQL